MSEKYIVKGLEPLKAIPQQSMGDFIFKHLLKNSSEDVAMINASTGGTISYNQLLLRTCQIAQALTRIGLKKDDVVSICSENSVFVFQPAIAALYIGAIAVPTNYMYTKGEMLHAMSISKPKIIFCSHSCLENILEIKDQLPFIKKIVLLDSTKSLYNSIESLETFLSHEDIMDVKSCGVLNTVNIQEQVGLIFYSSGTTGLPKGVMITHKNLHASILFRSDPRIHFDIENKNVLNILPFFHSYGFLVALNALINKVKIIFLSKFDPQIYLESIEKYKIQSLWIAPPIAVFFQKSSLIEKYDLSSIREIGCGGAPLRTEIEDAIKKRLKVPVVRQGYGLTETTAGVIMMSRNEYKPGSVGKVIPYMAAKVVGVDTGMPLGPGQIGELYFRGELIMKGYYENELATLDIITDGWLRSGDIGYYDEDYYFYIVDRLKELIKYKGFQVAPAELEKILLTHPKIQDAGVIGIPHETAGEVPLAFVVRQKDADLTEEEVQKFVAKQVSQQKYLRGGVVFINEIPKTQSGKILRRKLREINMSQKSKL